MEYVVKIGGSILTDKEVEKKLSGNFEEILSRLENQRKGVVVHGAGSFGHPQAERHGLKNGSYKGALEVHKAVSELNTYVLEELTENGLKPVPIHTSSIAFRDPETQLHLENLGQIIEEGFTPVLHGDMVLHKEKGASIISGDEIVAKIEKKYQTGKAGFCTSEKGVFNSEGEVIDEINSIEEFPDFGVEGKDVTGGMRGKVKEILEEGIQARIFGKDKLEEFLKGEKPGTLVNP